MAMKRPNSPLLSRAGCTLANCPQDRNTGATRSAAKRLPTSLRLGFKRPIPSRRWPWWVTRRATSGALGGWKQTSASPHQSASVVCRRLSDKPPAEASPATTRRTGVDDRGPPRLRLDARAAVALSAASRSALCAGRSRAARLLGELLSSRTGGGVSREESTPLSQLCGWCLFLSFTPISTIAPA